MVANNGKNLDMEKRPPTADNTWPSRLELKLQQFSAGLTAAWLSTRMAEQQCVRLDTNGDGVLSLEELSAELSDMGQSDRDIERLFCTLDVNGNRTLAATGSLLTPQAMALLMQRSGSLATGAASKCRE